MVSTLILNSSMIAMKISGSRTAWAWLMAWATESSPSERIGRMSVASIVVWCSIVGLSIWANAHVSAMACTRRVIPRSTARAAARRRG